MKGAAVTRACIIVAVWVAAGCSLDREGLRQPGGEAGVPTDAAFDAAFDAQAPDADGFDGGTPSDAGPPGDSGPRPDSGVDPLSMVAVTAGLGHTCALRSDGAVFCWGDDASGQLADGSSGGMSETPSRVPLPEPATALGSGGDFTCAVVRSGSLHCWGGNGSGQLGDGSTTDRPSPVLIVGGAVRAGGGASHGCFVGLSGGGLNDEGQLGVSGGDRSSHEMVAGLSAAGAVTGGALHTCAIAGGQVHCWGGNSEGQLGDDSTSGRSSPEAVAGLSGVTALAAGDLHTCAVHGLGTSCWGKGGDGRLGHGSTSDARLPVLVTGLTDARDVGAGVDHTCALHTDGAVSCWGKNDRSQLGPGTSDGSQSTPVRVPDLNATALAVGGSHACVIQGGEVWCWGRNNKRQLGTAGGDRAAPQRVPGLPE